MDVDRRVQLAVGGRVCEIELALPTVGEVVPDVREPARRRSDDVPYLILDAIDTIDRDVAGLRDAEEISRDPAALSMLLTARNRLWGEVRLGGRLHALCPHCRERESSFGLTTFAIALGTPPPPLFSADGIFVEIPTLANRRRSGTRATEIPCTPRLRAVLPSGLLDLEPRAAEAVLRDLDSDIEGAELETQAWTRWAPEGRTPPEGRAHWRRVSPGFRAILRMSVAVRELDGIPQVTPERIESMSLADFSFLDASYFLTHNVDQLRSDAMVVECAVCGGRYLPLR
jgi:hypothetical protein